VIRIAGKRKITRKDREIFRENALKGTKKWTRTPTGARRAERNRRAPGWGFDGKSPRTRKRTYKTKG
jgi:hypothetical protein